MRKPCPPILPHARIELFIDTSREVLAYISVWSHMADFSRGVVDSRYLLFDVTMSGLAFFLTVRVLAWRRVAG